MPRNTNWCFTLNNPTEPDDQIILQRLSESLHIKWMIFQREVGAPSTTSSGSVVSPGNVHLQGYLVLKRKKSLSTLRTLFPILVGAHWEQRRGSHKQAKAYCSKPSNQATGEITLSPTPLTFGEEPIQGKRNDIKDLVDHIKDNPDVTMRDLYESEEYRYTTFKYARHVITMKLHCVRPRSYLTQFVWLFGPTGVGKSYLARYLATEGHTCGSYSKNSANKWFDGYGGENIIINEFQEPSRDAPAISYRTLLQLIDEYPFCVETKGGTVQFTSKKGVITSNRPPWEYFTDLRDNSELKRRLEGHCFYMYIDSNGDRRCVPILWGYSYEQYVRRRFVSAEYVIPNLAESFRLSLPGNLPSNREILDRNGHGIVPDIFYV